MCLLFVIAYMSIKYYAIQQMWVKEEMIRYPLHYCCLVKKWHDGAHYALELERVQC